MTLQYMRINHGDLESIREAQYAAASPEAAGHARARANAIISATAPGVPVISIGFGDSMVVLDKDGNRLSKDQIAEHETENGQMSRGWQIDLSSVTPAGAIPTNKMIGGELRIPSGVVMVVGGANTAKTPIVHLLADSDAEGYAVVRYGEPMAGYIVDQNQAAVAIGQALLFEQDVALDSAKDLLALAGGGAMASGLSRGSLPILSDLSALAATVGSTIYIPINPSTDTAAVVEMVVEAAKSNVAMTVVNNGGDGSGIGTLWTAAIRRGEGLEREIVTFNAGFKAGSKIMHYNGFSGLSSGAKRAKTTGVSITSSTVVDEAFDGLIRRQFIPRS